MSVRPSFIPAVFVVAVLAISLAGPLVRLSTAHPIAIATWRLVFSLAIIAVPLVATGTWRQWRALGRRDIALAVAAGALLALHFWSWNASIALTTIAASVVLVNTQPVFVALLSTLWLRESPTVRQWTGIAVAMAGAVVVMLPDLLAGGMGALRGSASFGNGLAVLGAITAAVYYTIGRRLRTALDLWPYVALVYAACLVTLLALAAAMRVPLWPHPPRDVLIFAALAVGPMLLGHTLLNWALRHVRAYEVNVVLLGEPVGATLLAAMLPGIAERPGMLVIAGGALVLTGIALAEARSSRETASLD